jgi:hypothetical protein
MNLWFIALLVVVLIDAGVICFITHKHYEEKKEIFNRFMAGDYRAYMYFKDENKVVVDNLKKRLEAEREKVETEEDLEKKRAAEAF